MEGQVDKYRMPPISPKGAKNEKNSEAFLMGLAHRSILNLLLLAILVRIPLSFYVVYVTDGFFSRQFVDFALSSSLVLRIYYISSKMIGAINGHNDKKWELLKVNLNHMLMLLNLILVPLRLTEVYFADGLFSRRFVHFALCASALVLINLRLSEMISHGTCMVLLVPAFISLLATFEWELVFCITLAGSLVFFIISMYMLMMYE